jgi:phosphoribosylanthranilate isomerase
VRTRVKICGITTVEEATLAVDAGADALGMIFAESPRRISMERAGAIVHAVPLFMTLVAVFVDASPTCVQDAVRIGCVPQFCGDESPELCERAPLRPYIKVCHVSEQDTPAVIAEYTDRYEHAILLFDSRVAGLHGGTGKSFDWDIIRSIAARRRVMVSGGLTPENVGDCVRRVRPYAVDVRSGVETHGEKDPERMTAFVQAVREADA